MTVILCTLPNAGIWKRQSLPTVPFVQKRLFPVDCTANCDAALRPSKVETGTACDSCLSYDPEKRMHSWCRLQLCALILPYTFSFCTKRNPLSWFPLLALEALQRSFPIFLAVLSSSTCLLHLLHPPGQEPDSEKPGHGENAFLMKDVACSIPRRCGDCWMRGCVTASRNKNCGPRGMPLFSSQISQNQTEILAFSRIAIPPLKHASVKTSYWYF